MDDLRMSKAKPEDLATVSDQHCMKRPEQIKLLIAQYDFYMHHTLAGKRGKPAHLCMTYASFVNPFLISQMAITSTWI